MPTLCLSCLSSPSPAPPGRCTSCGGHIISHPDLFNLAIAHIDADSFYASIEKADHPELRDKPVIVGHPGRRGIVTTACYIARQYGIRSAQPMYQARQACPDAVIIPPRLDRYRAVSAQIRNLMEELTPLVQPLSLDEAYLDLRGTERLHGAPPARQLARLARQVRDEIGVTMSVGLSHTPFLAKIASDLEKPSGFSVIGRDETRAFLHDRPVTLLPGVGQQTEAALWRLRITTVGQIREAGRGTLMRALGTHGARLHLLAHGKDDRQIAPNPPAKSISKEATFESDLSDHAILQRHLWSLSEAVSAKAKTTGVAGSVVTLKLKHSNHRQITRQRHLDTASQLAEDIYQAGLALLFETERGGRYRLIGIGISDLIDADNVVRQGDMFTQAATDRSEKVERAVDEIRARFGDGVVKKGRSFN